MYSEVELSDQPDYSYDTSMALITAIEQGLRQESSYVSGQDMVFELLCWLENCPHLILKEIYAQALEHIISTSYYPINDVDVVSRAV